MIVTRELALAHLKKYIKNEKLLQHCYASEAVMKALAGRFGEDQEKWELPG